MLSLQNSNGAANPMKIAFSIMVIAVMLFACLPTENIESAEFAPLDNPLSGYPADFFDKQAVIFDANTICGTTGVGVDKLRHAANVAAERLDNDGDGLADEPALVSAIRSQPAVILMSAEGFTEEALEQIVEESDPGVLQDLAANETNPLNEREERHPLSRTAR